MGGNSEKKGKGKPKREVLDAHAINKVKNKEKRQKLYKRFLRRKRQVKILLFVFFL